MGQVLVAFSGGVDSTFLLAAAVECLGAEKVLAVTGLSPSMSAAERDEAVALTRRLGARHRMLETGELARPEYVANAADRCYFCKTDLFERLNGLARAEGCAWILDGANVDDLGDVRPGREAARQQGVRSPLVEAGLSKADIRALSRWMELPTWEKPAMACLASRIPHGTPVTIERLGQIEAAESALRELGFQQVRVRHHEAIARIELASPAERAPVRGSGSRRLPPGRPAHRLTPGRAPHAPGPSAPAKRRREALASRPYLAPALSFSRSATDASCTPAPVSCASKRSNASSSRACSSGPGARSAMGNRIWFSLAMWPRRSWM
jgi:uncharacterized protein